MKRIRRSGKRKRNNSNSNRLLQPMPLLRAMKWLRRTTCLLMPAMELLLMNSSISSGKVTSQQRLPESRQLLRRLVRLAILRDKMLPRSKKRPFRNKGSQTAPPNHLASLASPSATKPSKNRLRLTVPKRWSTRRSNQPPSKPNSLSLSLNHSHHSLSQYLSPQQFKNNPQLSPQLSKNSVNLPIISEKSLQLWIASLPKSKPSFNKCRRSSPAKRKLERRPRDLLIRGQER